MVIPDVEEAGPVPVHPGGLQPAQRGQGVVIEDEPLQVLVVGVKVGERLQGRDLILDFLNANAKYYSTMS